MRLVREPLLHFLVLGAALFGLFALVRGRLAGAPERIEVTAGQIEHLASGFERTWQRPPTVRELDALVDDWVREEIYYREAMTLGIDRDDTVVRRRLWQKMEFLVEDASASAAPTDADLQAYLDAHPEAFRTEPVLTLRQVYLSRDRRGAAVERDADALVTRLRTAGPNADLRGLGDPLSLPAEVPHAPRSEVARLFGDAFAARAERLPLEQWTGPVESGYGVHVVFVRERVEGRLPALAEVQAAVRREWLAARREATVEAAYRRLRERYTVVIDRPVGEAGPVAAVR